ncbi:cell division protein FtsK [Spirochaetia bacterium]|nr:cell division protein FtsK [Spirochaetia bacterium]
MAAVILGLCSLFLGISIAGAILGLMGNHSGPGSFFAASYGPLAFVIPAYLFFAAFILAENEWRPDRLFILGTIIFPFLTLAVGFAFMRDFDARSEEFALLEFTGKTGFRFIIVLLTVFEILIISVIKILLFSGGTRMRPNGSPAAANQENNPTLLLPAPKSKLKDIYTEAAAAHQGSSRNEGPPPSLAETGSFLKTAAQSIRTSTEQPTEFPQKADPAEQTGIVLKFYPSKFDTGTTNPVHPASPVQQVLELVDSVESDPVKHPVFIDLPELKPLASVAAMKQLDPDWAGNVAADSEIEDPEEVNNVEDTGDFEDIEDLFEAEEPEIVSIKPKTVPKTKIHGKWHVPVEILNQYPDGEYWIIDDATRQAAVTLRETLEEFKIQAEVTGIRKGPVITMFEILPAPGVKLSKIVNLQDNIALRLAASSVRIVAPIPGKHAVGIEVPNAKRNIVSFREIIEGELHREGKKLEIPVVLGKDITGEAQTVDLIQMPHLLIAGSTGSGKSVCVNSMILSILYQRAPAECRLILIDPKIVELKLYNDIPHLLTPVITEPKKAFQALQYCIYEMERRYACLDSMGVRDIRSYNKRIKERDIATEHMPYIVVVIDEFADLMATTGKELESTVARLAAMSRAVGIHLVLATQRPSIDVITGLIKANIPSRIAFMVASKMDSRIIIDQVGAEKLLGKGDMLYAGAVDPFPVRMQGAFISEEEVEAVVEHVKTLGQPDYIDDEIFYDEDEDEASPSLFSDGEDPLYDKALEIVLQQGKASASYIQRRLKIGYNRAARLVEEMEQHGVVGPAQGSKPRELLRAYSS